MQPVGRAGRTLPGPSRAGAFPPMGLCKRLVLEGETRCIRIRLKELSTWINSFVLFFFLLCFSTSESMAMRDLKVFERGY